MKALVASLLMSSAAMAADCNWAAPDHTGRVWSHGSSCNVVQSGPVTEVTIGPRDTSWQVIGNVGRQIIPKFIWSKETGWLRENSRDHVIWEGSVSRSSTPCAVGGKPSSNLDFSNGMRICLLEKGP